MFTVELKPSLQALQPACTMPCKPRGPTEKPTDVFMSLTRYECRSSRFSCLLEEERKEKMENQGHPKTRIVISELRDSQGSLHIGEAFSGGRGGCTRSTCCYPYGTAAPVYTVWHYSCVAVYRILAWKQQVA